jgi:DNA-binding NtrC family response regulator
LQHAVERAVVVAEGKPRVEEADLPPEILIGRATAASSSSSRLLADIERQHILRVLEECGGNRKETASALGIGTKTLWRKLRTYGA